MNSSLSPGTKFGRYEIGSQLGAGGMGEVYLALHAKYPRLDNLRSDRRFANFVKRVGLPQ